MALRKQLDGILMNMDHRLPKVSIITVVLNNQKFIETCINSVISQLYKNFEYIIVDGGSTDATLDIIKGYAGKISKLVSEKDDGIYDAMNKGIKLASGDIIGFLNSDDMYANSLVLDSMVKAIKENRSDSCYGDLVYVDRKDTGKVIRYWKSRKHKKNLFRRGWMPAQPTFFAKKDVYERYGYFNTKLSISADYELMVRFIERYGISTSYIPEVLVKMRMGGSSNKNPKNIIRKSIEDYRARKINCVKGGVGTIILKNISKIPQFFLKRTIR